MDNKPVLLASTVLAVSLIICSFVLKGSNLMQSYIPAPQASTLSVPDNFRVTQDDVMLLNDASRYLGMSEEALKYAIEQSELPGLPYMKMGDNYLFSKGLLDSWVAENARKNSTFHVKTEF